MAAIWANYSPDELAERDTETRILIMALYRTQLQIDAVIADHQSKQRPKHQ